ncbi:unnamed protein product, partial [marine sediment metagenome]
MQDYEYSSIFRYRQMMNMLFIFYPIIFILIFIFFFAWPPIKNIIEAKYEIMQAQAKGLNILPELEGKLKSLEKQTAVLTTENIDSRLNRIEKAIAVGEVKPDELVSLQEVRNDLTNLKTFMFSDPEKFIEFRTLQKDYLELKADSDKMMEKDDIQREIDSVRHLFYATLG